MSENVIHIYSDIWDSLFLFHEGKFQKDLRSMKN